MQNTLKIAAVAALALLALTHTARAQVACFPRDAVISRDIPGEVNIGYASMNNQAALKNRTSPSVKMTGGKVSGAVFVWNRSTLLVSAGTLAGTVNAQDNSKITLSGGSASGDLEAQANSIVEVRGGSVYRLYAKDHGTLNLRGGSIAEIYIEDHGTINIYGTGLSKKSVDSHSQGMLAKYVLSGKLTDGTSINGKMLLVPERDGAKVNLINTPAAH